MVLSAIPFYLLAIIMVYIFAVELRWLPPAGGVETTRIMRLDWATTVDVLNAFAGFGCKASPGHVEGSIHLDQAVKLESLPGYADGLWCVQDEAAMSASILLAPKPGEQILDMCAAPGGKTLQLQR